VPLLDVGADATGTTYRTRCSGYANEISNTSPSGRSI
jgi:hypothetical protein